MAYLGNQPLLSTMRTVAEGTAYANQTEIPVPGGYVSGLVDVVVNGVELGSGDYDSTNGASIKLYVPMVLGSMYKVVAWTPNQTVVNAGGQLETFRNKIINGNFDVWQRGSSLASASGNRYLADRWRNESVGSTYTTSLQSFALGQTSVPGEPTYFHRTVVTSAAGAANFTVLAQPIESVRTLAGQTVTLSFWAKADASKNIAVEFTQNFGTGGSPSGVVNSIGVTTCALTTGWNKFTVTATLPSIAGKTLGSNGDDALLLYFWYEAGSNSNARTNSLGQRSGTFDIAQVQLEAGPVATQFEVRPAAVETILCQRYYEVVHFPSESRAAASILWGNATPCSISVQFKVSKRTANPIMTELTAGTQTHARVYVATWLTVHLQPPQGGSGDWWSYGNTAAASSEL